MACDGVKRIILWGDTQVGKTAMLSALLYYPGSQPAGMDAGGSAAERNRVLQEHWRLIRNNKPVPPTANERVDLTLNMLGGGTAQIMDIKGGVVRGLAKKDTQDLLQIADGVLFLVEWNASSMGDQLAAVEGGFALAGNRAKGLAFTKCEIGLPSDDLAWESRTDWWRKAGAWGRHEQVLGQFGQAVWATSVYGFNRQTHRRAVILGEFGQEMPYQIEPRNIKEPFEWMFRRIGL
jgi:hypothetical protein